MGSAITASFATHFPDLVEGDIVLLASAGNFPVCLNNCVSFDVNVLTFFVCFFSTTS